MLLINGVTADSVQKQNLVLPDGSTVTLIIQFMPQQYGWFIQNLTYKTFQLQGRRIANHPNMLRQYKNQIPFGLACYSIGNREPSLQQDFVTGQSNLYILTAAEVLQYEAYL